VIAARNLMARIDRISELASEFLGLTGKTQPPFVEYRSRFRGRRRMLARLGTELGRQVTWKISDPAAPDSELTEIFSATTHIHKMLHYLPVYESALAEFRSRPVRMLEIGVARGGSLQMWRRYLHPESTIVGIDVDPTTRRYDDPERRIHVRVGSQVDTAFLQRVVNELGPFQVILDDGSHMTSHVVETFRYMFAAGLADGGVYIVEDLHSNYWRSFRDSSVTFADFTKTLIDAMHAHYHGTQTELQFRAGHKRRKAEFQVPLATTLVEKVEFYDSVAVIHRADGFRAVPVSVLKSFD
jgi:hypothetical protein